MFAKFAIALPRTDYTVFPIEKLLCLYAVLRILIDFGRLDPDPDPDRHWEKRG